MWLLIKILFIIDKTLPWKLHEGRLHRRVPVSVFSSYVVVETRSFVPFCRNTSNDFKNVLIFAVQEVWVCQDCENVIICFQISSFHHLCCKISIQDLCWRWKFQTKVWWCRAAFRKDGLNHVFDFSDLLLSAVAGSSLSFSFGISILFYFV